MYLTQIMYYTYIPENSQIIKKTTKMGTNLSIHIASENIPVVSKDLEFVMTHLLGRYKL